MATKTQDRLGPIGTLLSAALVASCCLGPVLFLHTLSALGTLGFWGYGFYRLYLRRPVTAGAQCATGSCERPSSGARVLLWIALAVLIVAITYPSLAVRGLG